MFGTLIFLVIATMSWSLQPKGTDIVLDCFGAKPCSISEDQYKWMAQIQHYWYPFQLVE
jgi:hypothetical protein